MNLKINQLNLEVLKLNCLNLFTGELGCGVVKLADWENLAEVHEAVTLLDGRKQTATKYVTY